MPQAPDAFADLDPSVPIYRLLKDCFMEDDTLHPEDEHVAYTGVPNEYMEPLNAAARTRMREFLLELDDAARKAAEKAGRPFTGRVTDFAEQIALSLQDARNEAARVQIMTPRRRQVPLRPDLIPAGQRRVQKKVLASKAPAPEDRPAPTPIAIQGKDYDAGVASNSTL